MGVNWKSNRFLQFKTCSRLQISSLFFSFKRRIVATIILHVFTWDVIDDSRTFILCFAAKPASIHTVHKLFLMLWNEQFSNWKISKNITREYWKTAQLFTLTSNKTFVFVFSVQIKTNIIYFGEIWIRISKSVCWKCSRSFHYWYSNIM